MRVLPAIGWVILDVTLWGFIAKYLNVFSAGGHNLVPQLLGAVLLWDFLVRAMQGFTTAFLEDVWSRKGKAGYPPHCMRRNAGKGLKPAAHA